MKKIIAISLCVFGLNGCSTLGLGESSTYSCKAPKGVSCNSVSGIYANALANNLPGQKRESSNVEVSDTPSTDSKNIIPLAGFARYEDRAGLRHSGYLTNPSKLLSTENVVRIKVYPWEDLNKVLHDQTYIYVVAKDSKWTIPHNKIKAKNKGHYFGFEGQSSPRKFK